MIALRALHCRALFAQHAPFPVAVAAFHYPVAKAPGTKHLVKAVGILYYRGHSAVA
jgi:hypothetical protein